MSETYLRPAIFILIIRISDGNESYWNDGARTVGAAGPASYVSAYEAMKFVNSEGGRKLRLRGINARVLKPGRIAVGDIARKRQLRKPYSSTQ